MENYNFQKKENLLLLINDIITEKENLRESLVFFKKDIENLKDENFLEQMRNYIKIKDLVSSVVLNEIILKRNNLHKKYDQKVWTKIFNKNMKENKNITEEKDIDYVKLKSCFFWREFLEKNRVLYFVQR